MPNPGETICGDIELERLAPASLGAKVLRPVFVANRPGVSRMWLTVVDGALTPTSMDLSRFMAGANALLELRHPSLCRAVTVDREMSYCVVGYEMLASAEVLADLVGRKQAQPPLGRTALEIARGIAFLHRNGFVHGIVSPATVLVWEGVTVLWQYGLSALCVPDLFGPRACGATAEACAPELARGEPVTPATDVYGWGAVVAALASGRSPELAVVAARQGKIPELHAVGLHEIVRAAVAESPSARPTSGVDLLRVLTSGLASEAGSAAPWESQSSTGDGLHALAAQYLEEMNALEARKPVVESAVPGPVPSAEDSSGALGRVALKRVESGPIKLVEKRRAGTSKDPRTAASSTRIPAVRPDDPEAAAHEPVGGPPPAPSRAAAAPGGRHPRPAEEGSGWMRPSEANPDGPAEPRPKWPRAKNLGDGLRKRSFGDATPDPADLSDTPKEGIALPAEPDSEPDQLDALDAPRLEPDAVLDRQAPHPDASDSDVGLAASPSPADSVEGATEPTDLPPERTGVEPIARTPATYKPPRMPGPHGPPAIPLAILIALAAGALAVLGTVRAVQAHGSFSALFGEGRGEQRARPELAVPDTTDLIACPDGTTVITGDPDDPLAGVCIETAEYPGWMEEPAHDVAFVDAQKLCADRGRRLCTSDEWRRACGGLTQRSWPYGDEYVRGHCKSADAGDKTLARAGQREHCRTPQGVADMVGNVAEWVAEGVVLGGSIDVRKPTCRTEAKVPKKGRENVGLRCCVDLR